MPFFNWLCFLIFYKLAFNLNRDIIQKILEWFSYALCLYLFYCILQFFNLDPYFKVVGYFGNNPEYKVVGLLGNQTQNALYLAICLPIFYLNKNCFSILNACLIWAILAITGSASAIATALIVTLFFNCFYRLPKVYFLYLFLGSVGFITLKWDFLPTYLNPHKRLEIWTKLWSYIKIQPIFGQGLGAMNVIAQKKELFAWRHAHNEYWHFLVETGFIGLFLILYCIWEYFRKIFKDRLAVTLASLFLGFCIAALLYYPAHLFLPATVGMFSYTFMYVLKNNENEEEECSLLFTK
jgi:O-antigen ligase